MKKTFMLVISALFLLSMCACNSISNEPKKDNGGQIMGPSSFSSLPSETNEPKNDNDAPSSSTKGVETGSVPTSNGDASSNLAGKSDTSSTPAQGSMPPFYYAKSVDELIQWIKTAPDDDFRKHFLSVARQFDSILTVNTKQDGYVLKEIVVHPDHEYMVYHFFDKKNKNDIISIGVSLSRNNVSLSVNRLKDEYSYENVPFKESVATIQGEKVPLIYHDEGEYTLKGSEKKGSVWAGARLKIAESEVSVSLLTIPKNSAADKKWDNKYLDLFEFKSVKIK